MGQKSIIISIAVIIFAVIFAVLFILSRTQTATNTRKTQKADVAVIACGSLVHSAVLAAAELEKDGISVKVINNASIKPMDKEVIVSAAKEAGAVVTVEEHQVAGGMGSAVAEILAKHHPVPIEFIGVQNRFGESGEPTELIEHFGMGVKHIREAARKVMRRK